VENGARPGRVAVGGVAHAARAGIARRLASLRVDVSFAVVDALMIAAAYTAALVLRFAEQPNGVPRSWWIDFAWVLPVIICVHLIANILVGTYGHVWEHASVAEAIRIVLASAGAGTAMLATVLAARAWLGVVGPIPVGSLVLGSLLTVMLMGAVRFRARLFSFNRRQAATGPARRVLVVGTGQLAATLARHRGIDGQRIDVVGFVSTQAERMDRRLAGLPVLGTIEDTPGLIRAQAIDEVIVATGDGAHVVRRLVDLCLEVDVRLRIVPDIGSALQDSAKIQDVRDLEPDDLLDRPAVDTDLHEVGETLRGRRVLVTGAGGSIGSELVRQVLGMDPAILLVLDHDETHLHEATQMWSGYGVPVEAILCDIRDRTRVLRAFDDSRPQVVFHAAAHKHVPILEKCPDEAVKTNVLGTEYLLQASRRVGVERFVLISTDKACNPVGVMGASKRMAEMLVQVAARISDTGIYSAVRFGNVLGSRGSVVPTFVDQIKRGGPVTVTDPDMTRYFMTIAEAVQLVLQASAIAENGDVLVLDMGEPVRILDLAHRLIRMAGLVPERDIEVVYTGRRPGEKLHEVLSTGELRPSPHPAISVAESGAPGAITLHDTVHTLVKLANRGDGDAIRELLLAFAGRDWDCHETIHLDDLPELSSSEGVR
jgi:FlaA1/EpsC-like NDP-sugar epimerase